MRTHLHTARSSARPALALTCAGLLGALAAAGHAQPSAPAATPAPSPSATSIAPEVARRDIRVPRLPNKDYEVGAFVGTYATQNFGAAAVAGLRLGYHITEDFFVQAALGRSRVSDEAFRQVLPGGVFAEQKENLSYANLSLGWNALPGEAFIGAGRARATTMYALAGVGTTHFAGQRRQTFNLGFGARMLFSDWVAAQVDLRDHVFSLDLLGKRQSTHNLEATLGFAFYF